jgi:hypothetical protein
MAHLTTLSAKPDAGDAIGVDPALLKRSERPTHPLRAWRETQMVRDRVSKKLRPMSIAEAAARFSAFVGRIVPYQTWMMWERYRDEKNSRIPSYGDMQSLFLFTGEVRSDHFYEINTLRARAGAAERGPGRRPESGVAADGGG